MNPIYKQSLDCGVIPSEPHISISFFPSDLKDYIIIENSEIEGDYEYMDEVVSYLSGITSKNSIKIIQIKMSSKDKDIYGIPKYQGLSLSQFNFLIKNSKLLISNSRYSLDSARTLKVPTIGIINKKHIQLDNPYWHTGKFIDLEKDCYAEEVCKHGLSFLNISNPFEKVSPFYCGGLFKSKTLEIVPNFDPDCLKLKNENINIRADFHFNKENIEKLIINNKVNLICTNIPKIDLPPELLNKNLIQINLEVSENTTEKEIAQAKKLCKSTNLFSKNQESIQKIRLKFIDEKISLESITRKKDLDICSKICENTYYKSSKIIISERKNYTSLAAMKKKQELNPRKLEKIIDNDDFWQELEHFKLLNINHEQE